MTRKHRDQRQHPAALYCVGQCASHSLPPTTLKRGGTVRTQNRRLCGHQRAVSSNACRLLSIAMSCPHIE